MFQTAFSDCWKFKRKEKLNKIKILLFLYDINDSILNTKLIQSCILNTKEKLAYLGGVSAFLIYR